MLAGPALLLATAGHAQSNPPALPSRPQVEQPRPERPEPAAHVRVNGAGAIAAAPCPLRSYDLKVKIERLAFTGFNGAPLAPEVARLLAAVQPPAAGSQDIAVICDLRDEATARLRRAGYIATVQIPPQTIATNELRLEVITAHIVEVRVHGDAPPYRQTLAARAEQLKALNPLNERDAERILLIAGDIPGLDVQLALQPAGTVPGEVIGDLNIAYRPYSLMANANNYGSRQLGRETAYVRGELYGLTGASDVTYLGASTTFDLREQKVVQIGHMTGLGHDGVTLEGSFLYAWSRPDLGVLDLRSETLIGDLVLSAPLQRTRRTRSNLAGGFEIIEQRTRVFSGATPAPLNRDKLRVAFLRGDIQIRDFLPGGGEAYSLAASLEVRKGLGIFGATHRGEIAPSGYTPSRFNGDPQAVVVRADLSGVVGIGPVFSLHARVHGQWSNHALLNFEEYSLGNLTIGRGYDPGANSADRAVAARIEPRARLFDDGRHRLEAFGFYDSVWIWNLDPNATENDRRLGSWGGGLRALLPGIAVLEAMYAHPEDKALLVPGARRAPARVLVSLTLQSPPGGR
ncbi:MAG: ShlB/FhaC/HecB family hemolysin secretion/activation protein [Alphaproteobacteria bacterium]|nr:ShlB/FhaC/HecB family hemolysin secretion/activation protein [Alphaproteobacteria bacterium]